MAIKEWWGFFKALSLVLVGKTSLVTIFMCVFLMGSAVSVVYASHLNRQLFSELKRLQLARDAYQMEWSQLLLEQSAWSAHGRIEHKAIIGLGMKIPEAKDIVIVR